MPPSTSTTRFLRTGSTMFHGLKTAPVIAVTATEIATLYATSATMSSYATTCSNVSTKSPFAFVCLIVIIVEAGAVAEANAARTIENARSKFKI